MKSERRYWITAPFGISDFSEESLIKERCRFLNIFGKA